MSDENENDGEWDEKSDLTRIEDLSEFLHIEDDELNQKFEDADLSANEDEQQAQGEDLLGLSDLEDDPDGTDNDIGFNDSEEDEPAAFGEFQDQEDDMPQEEDSISLSELESNNEESNFESEAPAFSEFDEQTEPDRDIEDINGDFTSEESIDVENENLEDVSFDTNLDSSFNEETNEEVSADSLEGSFNEEQDSFSSDALDGPTQDEAFEESGFESEEIQEEENQWGETEELQEEEGLEPALKQSDDTDLAQESFELPDPEDLESQRQEIAQELDHTPPPVLGVSTQEDSPLSTATRENFQDLRDFGNSISYGLVQTGGNPPYSLIVRQLKFEEDARDILIILREHGLVTSENEDTISQGLEQGSLLISQISEYSAIYLAHRLRRFDLDLRIGLSDQLHPSKSYNPENKGLVSKHNLAQNFQEDVILEDRVVHIEDIVMATTPTIEGYSIYKYLDVMTSHTIIKEDELKRISGTISPEETEDESGFSLESSVYESLHSDGPEIMNNYSLGLNEIYQELSIELKNQAFKLEANAVVGIAFALTPMIDSEHTKGNTTYKITCSGNAVWIVDKQN